MNLMMTVDFQTINSWHNTLITIGIALENKTMSREYAKMHIQALIQMANSMKFRANGNDILALIDSFIRIAESILRSTEIQIPGYER